MTSIVRIRMPPRTKSEIRDPIAPVPDGSPTANQESESPERSLRQPTFATNPRPAGNREDDLRQSKACPDRSRPQDHAISRRPCTSARRLLHPCSPRAPDGTGFQDKSRPPRLPYSPPREITAPPSACPVEPHFPTNTQRQDWFSPLAVRWRRQADTSAPPAPHRLRLRSPPDRSIRFAAPPRDRPPPPPSRTSTLPAAYLLWRRVRSDRHCPVCSPSQPRLRRRSSF